MRCTAGNFRRLNMCKNASRIAVLENVVNPTNVGAIFRPAAALSMDAVLLTPDCSDPFIPPCGAGKYGNRVSGSVEFSAG